MEIAEFSFENYIFSDIEIHIHNATDNLTLQLHPQGYLNIEENSYSLQLDFRALSEKPEPNNLLVYVRCIAKFKMSEEVNEINKIPNYFYANSIAIVFPYIRAFVSTLTLQSNTRPIILPTMNLTSLGNELRQNTQIV